MTRVYAIADPSEAADPTYIEGLKGTLAAALDYALEGIERGEKQVPPVPVQLLAQARLAARNGVSLDTVLRRYFAGYTLFGDYLVEEAERGDLVSGSGLKPLLGTQASLFDRLLATVSAEYAREEENRFRTPEMRRTERIKRLLAGESIDVSDLSYNFEGWHLGVVASGLDCEGTARELLSAFDCRLLLVHPNKVTVWAWMGSRQRIDSTAVKDLVSTSKSPTAPVTLTIGESSEGLVGWRFTHHQALAALPVALRSRSVAVRYADVALFATMIRDDLLVSSLHEIYLKPLGQERDGGNSARRTLRAYIDAEQNVTSAAAALGVSRNTVANRLRMIEEAIDRPLAACVADLEAALNIDELNRWPSSLAELANR